MKLNKNMKHKKIKEWAILTPKYICSPKEYPYYDIDIDDLFYEKIYAIAEVNRRNFIEKKEKLGKTKYKVVSCEIILKK